MQFSGIADSEGLFHICGMKRRPAYYGSGNALSLVDDLVFLQGMRQRLERLALSAKRFLPRVAVRNPAALEAWGLVRDTLPVRDAFLLDTAWYKDTVFVGPVRAEDGRSLFVKVFVDEMKASAQTVQARSVGRLAEGYFRTAAVAVERGPLVAFELLQHGARQSTSVDLRSQVIAMSKATAGAEPSVAVCDLRNWAAFTDLLRCFDVAVDIDDLAQCADRVPLAPCHGDCTPWNMFYDREGYACLIDYERSETTTAFSDLFHYDVQLAILAGRRPSAADLIDAYTTILARTRSETARLLALYLCRQLEIDLNERLHGRDHHQIRTLVAEKARLLRETLRRSKEVS